MTKKVYDLAKEYDIQSKDMVELLNQAKIEVKNHMSALSDQQEKYFKNNYSIVEGKLVVKDFQPKEAVKKTETKPVQKPASPTANKPAGASQSIRQKSNKAQQVSQTQNTQPRNSQNRDNSQYQSRQGGYNNQNREGGYQNRNQSQQRTDSQGRPSGQYQQNRSYQGRNNQGGYNNQNREGGYQNRNQTQQRTDSQGRPSGQYQQNRSYQGRNNQGGYNNQNREGGYQNRNQTQQRTDSQGRPSGQYQQNRSYQGRNNQGGYNNQNREGGYQNRNSQQGSYNNRYPSNQQKRPAAQTGDRPLEKPKIDKNKKENKQRSDQKNKARENFFKDERPIGKLDNTKKTRGSKSTYKKKKLEHWEERATSGVTGVVVVPEVITVSELSEKILISSVEIIKILMSYGIMANINQSLDFDTVSIICEELDIEVRLEEEEDVFASMLDAQFADEDKLKRRPPIITVMGHVDHGKTSLLDAIRNTNVIKGEAGGITQHIGAYTIMMRDNPITFIDTPGHEAFTAMRSRGASVTDIAVLVVAADDGVKPQTVEAINHAKAAQVPIIVAINKIDKPTANVDKVKQEISDYGLIPEDWGGKTICAEISAKTGQGIDNLLDMILLVAEVEDLKANFEGEALGTVIEARIDKQRGITASLLVKTGTLHDGDIIVTGTIFGKVRTMNDHNAKRVMKAGPSMAVEVLGLDEVPSAGDKFFAVANERDARKITDSRKDRQRLLKIKSAAPKTLDDIFNQMHEGELKEISLIVKADVQGSFEAIKQSLEKLNDNDDGIKISVIHGGVGSVTETDVSLASASDAVVIAFNTKADINTKNLADKEEVQIKSYSVIYDIIEDIQKAMKGLKEPEYEQIVTGTAIVRMAIKVPELGLIAGSYITDGAVTRKDKIRVIRNGEIIHDGDISSLKRFKDDVKEVASGYECGIGIEKFNDIKEEDTLEFYTVREKED